MSTDADRPSSLRTLQSVQRPSRASLIIRHAERYAVESAANNHHVGLTEKGFADAREFGSGLCGYDGLRLYHSPAKRCRETAQAIADGAGAKGIDILALEEDRYLSGSYCVLDDSCLKLADAMGPDFIRAWFTGRIDPSTIKVLPRAAGDLVDPIVRRLREPQGPRTLDINVSHDWNIMALRENFLGLRHEDLGWLGYLDGLVLFPRGRGIVIAYGKHRTMLEK